MTGLPRGFLAVLGALSCALAPLSAQAQLSTQQLPGSIGRLPQAATTPNDPAMVTPTISVDLAAGLQPPAGQENEQVDVADLRIEGMTLYRREDFPSLNALAGKTVALGALYQAANEITRRYAQDGYVLSLAYVPDQSIGDGVFRIAVIEGRVERVSIEGVSGTMAQTVARLARRAITGAPANVAEMERALLLINDLPGVRATGLLRPVSVGASAMSELVVQVRHKPFSVGFSIDNRGTRYVGPLQGLTDVTAASALGYGESIRVVGLASPTTKRQRYIGMDASVPIGGDGLRFETSVNRSLSVPGNELAQFNVDSDTVSIESALAYPIIRATGFSLTLSGGFRAVDSRSKVDRALNYEDRLRALRFAASFEENGWLEGVTRGAFRYTQNVSAFNASGGADRTSRLNMDVGAGFASMEVGRLQPLGGGFDIWAQGEAQRAFGVLSSFDEYAVGGSRFGRAFDASELTGKHGWAGSVELRYSLAELALPSDRAQIYVFSDTGSVWNTARRSTLSSGGAGIRLDTGLGIDGYIEFARVMGRPDGTSVRTPDQRIWAGVHVQY